MLILNRNYAILKRGSSKSERKNKRVFCLLYHTCVKFKCGFVLTFCKLEAPCNLIYTTLTKEEGLRPLNIHPTIAPDSFSVRHFFMRFKTPPHYVRFYQNIVKTFMLFYEVRINC